MNINHWKSLCCFSKIFALRSKHLSMHFCHYDKGIHSHHSFWTRQPPLPVSKIVDLSVYFLRTDTIKRHSVPSLHYTVDKLSKRCFECKRAVVSVGVRECTLSWWRVFRLRRLVLLISWKTADKQVVVYHSEFTVMANIFFSFFLVLEWSWTSIEFNISSINTGPWWSFLT